MIVIHINATTQPYILDTYKVVAPYGVDSEGAYNGSDNYFVVEDDGTTRIVSSEEDEVVELFNENNTHINIIKK